MPMATPDNIERFNRTVSTIFSLLYEEFPNPMNLGAESLAIAQNPDGISTW